MRLISIMACRPNTCRATVVPRQHLRLPGDRLLPARRIPHQREQIPTRTAPPFGFRVELCRVAGIADAIPTGERRTPVTSTPVDLRFTDAQGRQRVVYAVMRDSGIWHIRGIVGDRQFSRECGRWQAVERTVLWLRRHAHEPASPTPRPLGAVAAAIAIMMLLGAGAMASAQSDRSSSQAVQAFVAATREYALLHRRLENTLPRLEVTSNPETIDRVVQQLNTALRAARPDAGPGDFFTESLAVELRVRIDDALLAHGFGPADVRASEAAEGIDPAMAPLKVNGRFPWRYASAMFPCVLNALPALPPELQYRIVGNTLVLVDVHADLIIDLLPYALAETER
jgi:hypothetical protein